MQIRMRGNHIGVEKLKKSSKSNTSYLSMPEDQSAVGRIKYLGPKVESKDLTIGTKVFFGKDRHQITMDGDEILVMDEGNIYAVVEDDGEAIEEKDTATDSKAS